MIKIGFTGTRTGLTKIQSDNIELFLNDFKNITICHGDCVGADTDFHNLCLEHIKNHPDKTLSIHIYPPSDPKLRAFNKADILMPEKPYLIRNVDIVTDSEILIGCPIDKTKEDMRSGTWYTIRHAKKIGMQVVIF